MASIQIWNQSFSKSVKDQCLTDSISIKNMATKAQEFNRQLVPIIEFILSVATGFIFGFFGMEFLFGYLDFGFRLLVGMIGSLVVALSGMYFLAEKLNEENEAVHHHLHSE